MNIILIVRLGLNWSSRDISLTANFVWGDSTYIKAVESFTHKGVKGQMILRLTTIGFLITHTDRVILRIFLDSPLFQGFVLEFFQRSIRRQFLFYLKSCPLFIHFWLLSFFCSLLVGLKNFVIRSIYKN